MRTIRRFRCALANVKPLSFYNKDYTIICAGTYTLVEVLTVFYDAF